jgi:hypothetical protein
MRTNSRVCVEVDHIVDRFNWTTVVVNGRYEELTRSPAYKAARERACLLFKNRPDWWYPAAGKLVSNDTRARHLSGADRCHQRPSGRTGPRQAHPLEGFGCGDQSAPLVESRTPPAPKAAGAEVEQLISCQRHAPRSDWNRRHCALARARLP